jgi:hypothetical protein
MIELGEHRHIPCLLLELPLSQRNSKEKTLFINILIFKQNYLRMMITSPKAGETKSQDGR